MSKIEMYNGQGDLYLPDNIDTWEPLRGVPEESKALLRWVRKVDPEHQKWATIFARAGTKARHDILFKEKYNVPRILLYRADEQMDVIISPTSTCRITLTSSLKHTAKQPQFHLQKMIEYLNPKHEPYLLQDKEDDQFLWATTVGVTSMQTQRWGCLPIPAYSKCEPVVRFSLCPFDGTATSRDLDIDVRRNMFQFHQITWDNGRPDTTEIVLATFSGGEIHTVSGETQLVDWARTTIQASLGINIARNTKDLAEIIESRVHAQLTAPDIAIT